MSLPPSQFWDHIHPCSAMNKSANHFLLTHVAPGECRVRAIDNDDRVIDTLTLSKPPGELLPLPATSPRLPYPQSPQAGTVLAGLEEGATVSLSWSGDMGFVDRTESKPLAGTNDWTLVKITTPPLYEYVYWCRVVLSAKPGSTGTAWFDGVLTTPTTPAKM